MAACLRLFPSVCVFNTTEDSTPLKEIETYISVKKVSFLFPYRFTTFIQI